MRAAVALTSAAAWTVMAMLAVRVLAKLVVAPHEGMLAPLVACQAAVLVAASVAVIATDRGGAPLGATLPLRASTRAIACAALAGAALHLPASALGQLVTRFAPFSLEERLRHAVALFATGVSGRAAMVFAVALVGPAAEELFFRGALMASLRRAMSPLAASLAVAALFTASHPDPQMFPSIFVVALALAWVRSASGSLSPGLALHAGFNGVAAAGAASATSAWELAKDEPIDVRLAGLSIAVALASLAAAGRATPRAGDGATSTTLGAR